MNAVFTAAGRRVELLRAFRRAQAELGLGGRVVALDVDPLAPALHVADEAYVVPPFSDPDYLPVLLEVCRRTRPALLFPLIDLDIPFLADHRDELAAAGARAVVVPPEGARIAADKWATYQFFRAQGVPAPRSWLPDAARCEVERFPVFVKPRFGSASKDTFRANNARELDFFLDYVPDPIVQEYLPDAEITTDVVCDFAGNPLAVVSRQRIEVRAGEVAKGKTVYVPEVAAHSVTIARGLQAIGPITVQCKYRDGRPYFTEINARFGGGLPLALAAGVPVAAWLLALAVGRPVEAPPLGSYREGLYLTRFDDSLFLSETEYRRAEGRRIRPG